MGRPRKGTLTVVNGKLTARITFTDATGKRRYRKKVVANKTEGNQWIRDTLYNLDQQPALLRDGIETFAQLAAWYIETQAIEAVYKEGHKVAGLRDQRSALYRLRLLQSHFQGRPLKGITYGQIEAYKLARLSQVGPRGQPIKLATVHRELSLLRHLLNLAQREGWLVRNPFNAGKPLIVKAHERGRERVLSLEEESKLLTVCDGDRAHLRPIVICAIDTGFRANEIFSLTWADVNLSARFLQVQAMNCKTLKMRRVPISTRLLRELKSLITEKVSDSQRVFGIERSVAKAWKTACRLAGLQDLRLNDLRHTFDSRLLNAGFNSMAVSRLMGHAAPQQQGESKMTYHYAHLTAEGAESAVAMLDSIDAERRRRTATNQGHV